MASQGLDGADVFVPDGVAVDEAYARTTDLGVGAHPDDLELAMLVPIALAHGSDDRWFTGVVVTDGAGSARSGPFAATSDTEMVAVRRAEQRAAAEVGGYSAVIQLGHASSFARGAGFERVVDEIANVVRTTRPQNVYTHNLADKHPTHVAVGLATVLAIRSLPANERPYRVAGVEAWRDLDWMPDHDKVSMDATGREELGAALAACFPSQIEGGKRYDLASEGRRIANATLRDPHDTDRAEQLSVAMDLTPLIRNDDVDPIDFIAAAIDRFRAEVVSELRRLPRQR